MSEAKQPLPLASMPLKIFLQRMSRNLLIGICIILVSLIIGMIGYGITEKMHWVDAYLNAAMILSGMGPVEPLKTTEGKLFAGTYALFSGIVFLVVIAFIFAPVIHRFFHKFHLEEEKEKLKKGNKQG